MIGARAGGRERAASVLYRLSSRDRSVAAAVFRCTARLDPSPWPGARICGGIRMHGMGTGTGTVGGVTGPGVARARVGNH